MFRVDGFSEEADDDTRDDDDPEEKDSKVKVVDVSYDTRFVWLFTTSSLKNTTNKYKHHINATHQPKQL